MANWWETPGYDMSRDAVVSGGIRPPDAPPGWWDEMLGPDRWSATRGLAMPGDDVGAVTVGGSAPPPREPWPVRFAGDMWETAKALPGVMLDAARLPGDVAAGRVDPNSDEALARANDLAGVVTLKAGAIPGGGLRAGAKIVKGAPDDSPGGNLRMFHGSHSGQIHPDAADIFLSPDVEVAAFYAGEKGKMFEAVSKPGAKILDFDNLNEDFINKVMDSYSKGMLPNWLDEVVERGGREAVPDAMRVDNLVSSGGPLDDADFINWLYDNFEPDAVSAGGGAVVYNKNAFDFLPIDDVETIYSRKSNQNLPDTLTAGGPGGRVAGAAELADAPENNAEPIDWRALTDWLAEQPGAVSRDAISEAAERYSTGDVPRRADGGRTSKFREHILTGRKSKNVLDLRASQSAKINAAGKGNREMSKPDMLRELMRPESIVDRPPDDLHGGWPWPSPEWQGGMYPRQDQIYPAVPSGLIRDATPGRTDRLPMSLPGDTYVVPADVVSGLGQGNTEAGGRLLDAMFRDHKSAGGKLRASGGRAASPGHDKVQIIAAGGEYLIDPEVVYSLGKGDPDKGHKELDKWVRATRQRVVNHMTKLPGPRKD